jgi:hypothetical protein
MTNIQVYNRNFTPLFLHFHAFFAGKASLDAKTFSISGGISAERSVYPGLPYYPVNNVA